MRTKQIIWRGRPAAERVANSLAERARMNREYQMLTLFGGALAPETLCYEDNGTSARLVRNWVGGPTLDQTAHLDRPAILARLRDLLITLHGTGWIHGDLKPENIVCASTGPVLIDWEHAAPIGADVSTLQARAVTVGMAQPDLIWGRGPVRALFDFHAIDQMTAQ